ncbi:MAG TPA: AzlC family ABC transporter permease [Solirubrobacterales bacterium]|nr:AzlC family ABC transporter permease [Solirubrobacterales bacterium]
METEGNGLRAGIRAGAPISLASLLLGTSFGVLAEPVMGTVAPIVMSGIVFAGSAQFGSLAVLAAGGGAGAAIAAGVLLNMRYLPMGISIAASTKGGWFRRGLAAQPLIDAGWAMSYRGDGRYDIPFMWGVTAINYPMWVGGTALGVLAGDGIGDPDRLGLDALFPAFFLGLLVGEATEGRRGWVAALLGATLALTLAPVTPPGVPIMTACLAALVALVPSGNDS